MAGPFAGLSYIGSLFKDDIAAGAGGTLSLSNTTVTEAGAAALGPDLYLLWVGLVWTAGSATAVNVLVKHNSATANHDADFYNDDITGTTVIWMPDNRDGHIIVLPGDSIDFTVAGSGALVPHLEIRYGIGVH